jgi:membrane protein DedA with SNARE-associated domain/rhodanese-related sulfurtransferase
MAKRRHDRGLHRDGVVFPLGPHRVSRSPMPSPAKGDRIQLEITLSALLELLATHGVVLVFLLVLLEQLGLPLPAFPVLVVAGALSVDGHHSALGLVGAGAAACLLADMAWYAAGMRYGSKVQRTICRISISPDTCVRQTQSLFERWGVWSLMVAKFVPGLGTLATALSGSTRVRLQSFITFDLIGAALYVSLGVALGVYFQAAIDDVLRDLESLGRASGFVLAAAFGLFLAGKLWQRQRLLAELRGSRITLAELQDLMGSGRQHLFVDVRPASVRVRDGFIPGAIHIGVEGAAEPPSDVPTDAEIIVYCACPNEVSAALVANRLQRAGFRNVRPLVGGIDAWIEAGLPVERLSAAGATT